MFLLMCCISVQVSNFGKMETIELLPNGANIPVTEENKH